LVERIKTGIEGLDEVIEGGFPKGSLILLAGEPGTGKTVFSMKFLTKGCELNEPGVYISFAESHETLIENLSKHLGIDLAKLEAEKKLKILDFTTMKEEIGISAILKAILEEIRSFNAKRLVIDSFSAMAQAFKESIDVRIIVHTVLSKIVREMGCTTIIVEEVPIGEPKIGLGVEEFVADCVLRLKVSELDKRLFRELEILKLRGTKLNERKLVFTLKNGFKAFQAFKPKPIEKPGRFQPIQDMPDKYSTGSEDLDLMLEGGLPKGSSILLEVNEKVSREEYHLIAAPFMENFLAQGRGCWVIPSSGIDYGTLKRGTLSYGFSEEEFQNQVLIFDPYKTESYGETGANLIKLEGLDFRKDFQVIAKELIRLMEKTKNKALAASIGVDTLITFYGRENYEKILNIGIAHNKHCGSILILIIKGGNKSLIKNVSAIVDFHLRLTREHGCLLLYGIKPRTCLYVVEMDVSKGYPLPKLIPIV